MTRTTNKLRAGLACASFALLASFWSTNASADIPLTDPEKTGGWLVSMYGQVDAYVSWVFGHGINANGLGNLVGTNPSDRYLFVGPQFPIQGNPVPNGAIQDPQNDTKLNSPRIRGGFASTILGFNVIKQLNPNLKVTFKFGLWAGIANGLQGTFRSQNDQASVDWRDQWVQLEGPWGAVWGGRRLGLFNRGGMRMDWFLVHQHGVGHPCNVDSGGPAACGSTGVGSMFPNRNAQLGYGTPEVGGFHLDVAMLDPSMIEGQNGGASEWVRTPTPRFEAEAVYHREGNSTDEMNGWLNGLTQQIARIKEVPPDANSAGVPADAVRNVWGAGGGAWGRTHGFAIGATGWVGAGLGTATAFGNTAIDQQGTLRKHFGYLAATNYRIGDFELGGSYGSANCQETDWDKAPTNPNKITVIKEVRGIAAKVAYHLGPMVFSIDGVNLHYTWHRGETLSANVVSAGLLGAF